MIELRALGTLVLRDPDRDELHSLLAQPKRVALLAYLAIARPRGFHRRDTLLALLWPEQDDQHARSALNQALYHLRSALGKEALPSRGDGEIGIDPRAVSCDAVEFEAAIEAEDTARALGLYRGDLLQGFHVSGCGEFERWLEDERVWLRRRAARAAAALARCEEARGEPVAAGHWARRAFALAPDDEGEARNLIELMGRLGDRAGAVQAYEEFARRLRVEYEVEPAPETLATIRAVRTRQVATITSPAGAADQPPDRVGPVAPEPPVRAPPPGAPAPLPEPVPAFPDSGSPPLPEGSRRRWVVSGIIGLVVLGAIGLLGVSVRAAGAPDLPVQPPAIAILPFAYRGDSQLSYLGEGMADLLGARVDGAAGLRSIDQRALLSFLHRQGGIANSHHGRLAAERFGAGFFVLGSMVEAGGRLQMSATIYDDRAKVLSSIETVAGSETQIFDAADRLAQGILAGMQVRPLALAAAAGQSTSSLPAYKAYLEGEREFRAGRPEAKEAFRRAIELDTTFALAYYRLAIVTPAPENQVWLDHALRHGDRLAEHHRWMLEVVAARFRGDHTTADQRARQIVTARPDDPEGWLHLAYVTLNKAHLLGRAWIDSREAFERALALGPEDATAIWWLAAIAATERRLADFDSLTNRFLRLDCSAWCAGNARGRRAIMMGDTAGEARFVAELREQPDRAAKVSAGLVAYTIGDLLAGRRLWRLITEPHRSRGFRMTAHLTLAQFELTNGGWGATRTELAALGALDAGAALEHHAFFALTRFLQAPRSALLALRDSLQRWNPDSARGEGDGLIEVHRSAHPYLRLYLLGMLSARLGESAAALGYAAELEGADRSTSLGVFAGDQGPFVRAEVAWQGGRREEALMLLNQARYWTTDSRRTEHGDSPFFNQLHERFARAELLYELGRHEEALPWYRALSYDLLYTGPAHLRLAQIYERRGEPQKAIEHYSHFLELWRGSDPALQPLVQEARDAVARVR